MIAEFYVVPGDIPTLLGCKISEMLRVLKVGVNENNFELVLESVKPLDKIAILNSKFPRVFEGLRKPKLMVTNTKYTKMMTLHLGHNPCTAVHFAYNRK